MPVDLQSYLETRTTFRTSRNNHFDLLQKKQWASGPVFAGKTESVFDIQASGGRVPYFTRGIIISAHDER